MSDKFWEKMAWKAARKAHHRFFAVRRGTWYMEDIGVVVVFNNNPYTVHPEKRDQELALFRECLKDLGLSELGFAKYPKNEYTFAMLIRSPRENERLLADTMHEAMMEVLRRHLRQDKATPKT